jgi:hypothetical protein
MCNNELLLPAVGDLPPWVFGTAVYPSFSTIHSVNTISSTMAILDLGKKCKDVYFTIQR